MNRYRVTFVIESEESQHRWILESLEQGLYATESITEYDLKELNNTNEQESKCN